MIEDPLARRARLMGGNVPQLYAEPLHLVRGQGVWLHDARGRKYLDCYNNTAHVGHCHPGVVEAVHRQSRTLNTGTRYVSTVLLDYLDRLVATFEPPLRQVLMTCTGSEANDVAIRMCQAATGATGLIATDATYHGNTALTSALSTRRPPVGGRPPNVRLVPAPSATDPLGGSLEAQPEALAAAVAAAARDLRAAGHGVAALVLCPILANEGLIAAMPDLLGPAVAAVRAAGGLILCDEVQPGFGRIGSQMWGHAAIGLSPDVATLGKPMANGYPVAAVVARPEIMAAFRSAFGYFNTFAGTPVGAAAGMAVLDALEGEDLIGNARRVGYHALARLGALDHPAVAGVRGAGLFLAVELGGPDRRARAARVVEGMKDRGVLIGATGRDDHVLKIRPPMTATRGNLDLAIDTLEAALADLPA